MRHGARAGYVVTLLLAAGLGFWQTGATTAAEEKGNGLSWRRFDRALEQARVSGKPLLVDFYTDWCGWCKEMDRKTYAHAEIREQLSRSFILAKVNAESNQPILVKGRTVTEAQFALIMRVRSYPTTWFISPEGQPIAPVEGFVTPEKMAPVLRYIEGGWYKEMDFDLYMEKEKKGITKRSTPR